MESRVTQCSATLRRESTLACGGWFTATFRLQSDNFLPAANLYVRVSPLWHSSRESFGSPVFWNCSDPGSW